MKKYDVEFLPIAAKDLDVIFDYILLDSPNEAIAMLEKIMTRLEKLEDFPLLGKQLIHKSLNYYNFRMIIVEPYIIFYRFIDDIVYIYRILHGACDYIEALNPSDD